MILEKNSVYIVRNNNSFTIFLIWLIWNITINNHTFSEAFTIATDITFIIFILINVLVAFGYQKILDEQ